MFKLYRRSEEPQQNLPLPDSSDGAKPQMDINHEEVKFYFAVQV